MDLKVTGTKVKGIVVGTGYLNTSSCKSYYARQYVPFMEATVRNGRLVGKMYGVSYAGADTARRHGSASNFEWGIKMSADGRSFVIDPIRDKSKYSGSDDLVFYRW